MAAARIDDAVRGGDGIIAGVGGGGSIVRVWRWQEGGKQSCSRTHNLGKKLGRVRAQRRRRPPPPSLPTLSFAPGRGSASTGDRIVSFVDCVCLNVGRVWIAKSVLASEMQ